MAAAGSEDFISLTIMLAILVGILFIIAGILHLGVLADFFPSLYWMDLSLVWP